MVPSYNKGMFMINLSGNFLNHFNNIQDPRAQNHNLLHNLVDILVYTILAVICGADGWVDVETFAKANEEWLNTFLELPNGIGSHDIIGDLFSRIDPVEFQKSFISWIQYIAQITNGDIVPIDGKTLRSSYQDGDKKSAIHMVSAWSSINNLVLGQVKTADKSNEITAIPELLNMLDIEGSIVTIDAMGCQKKIAKKIVDKKADYVLAVKGNQENLYADIQAVFADIDNDDNKKTNTLPKEKQTDTKRCVGGNGELQANSDGDAEQKKVDEIKVEKNKATKANDKKTPKDCNIFEVKESEKDTNATREGLKKNSITMKQKKKAMVVMK